MAVTDATARFADVHYARTSEAKSLSPDGIWGFNAVSRSYLTDEAAHDLRELLRWSLHLGVIGPDVYLARLAALVEMSHAECAASQYAAMVLHAEDWSRDDGNWPEEDKQSLPSGTFSTGEDCVVEWGNSPFEDCIVRFTPGASTGLQDWFFRIGDADPFPAVPHGHGRLDHRKKLDPYQGFISRAGKQLDREPRIKIIALWNDKLFRDFATDAINHFVSANPNWNWQGRNPMILPRRRRWLP